MATKATYPEYAQLNLPAFEQEILKRWEQEKTFEQSIAQREGRPSFVFYEGLLQPMDCRVFIMSFPGH